MKERLFFLLKVILAYVGVFAIGKIAFMAAHWTSDDDALHTIDDGAQTLYRVIVYNLTDHVLLIRTNRQR